MVDIDIMELEWLNQCGTCGALHRNYLDALECCANTWDVQGYRCSMCDALFDEEDTDWIQEHIEFHRMEE